MKPVNGGWTLIESIKHWNSYINVLRKDAIKEYKNSEYANWALERDSKGNPIITEQIVPDRYPCLVYTEFNVTGQQFDHVFMYYEDAVTLVDSKEEQINGK